MRARWLALGLLLGLVSFAWGQQGGPGFHMAASCASLANPVTNSTVCWQTTAPVGWLSWNGSAYVGGSTIGPFTPTSLTSGALLVGAGTGPVTTTFTPIVDTLTTQTQPAITVLPFGIATGNTGEVRLRELAANGTEYVYTKAPDAIGTTWGLKWPNSPGSSGQCLGTDGANPVSAAWVTCAGGSGSGITTLGGLNFGTAPVQTFGNDTNVTMVSAVATHTLTWAGVLAVARGGSGKSTFTVNGVLMGNGAGDFQVTAAGAADMVLRVPGAGGTPAFGAVDVSKAAAITGLVRTANLGSGSATSSTFLRGDQTWAMTPGVPTYNYVFNSDMEVWGSGPAVAPTGWTLGVSVTAAKTTTAGEFKTGTAAVAITATAASSMTQNLALVYPPVSFWQSQVVTCGAWARATLAASTKLRLADGVGFTDSAEHTGGGTLEFLTVSRSISNVATVVTLGLFLSQITTSQFDSVICVLGASVANWQPSGYLGRKNIVQHTMGANSVSAAGGSFFGYTGPALIADRPTVSVPLPFRCVARNFQALVSVAPGGADTDAFRLDINEVAGLQTCVIAAAAVQCSDTATEAIISKGARTVSRIGRTATAAATQSTTSFECEEVPEGI